MNALIPDSLTTMECLIVHEVLQRMKQRILAGHPSGQVIDQAVKETVRIGLLRNSQSGAG